MLNDVARQIYEVIEEKGHHSIEHTHIETITFRQLLHLVDEWTELMNARHRMQYGTPGEKRREREGMIEEGADILIVALDLCAMHDVDLGEVDLSTIYMGTINHLLLDVPLLVGQMASVYRKQRLIHQEAMCKLLRTVGEILRRHGVNPIEAVEWKMEINSQRPPRYGTKEVAA
jgi:NTP pyrophosphatase (non-canonical NTP hydrolase)